jgi:hypothetical protein
VVASSAGTKSLWCEALDRNLRATPSSQPVLWGGSRHLRQSLDRQAEVTEWASSALSLRRLCLTNRSSLDQALGARTDYDRPVAEATGGEINTAPVFGACFRGRKNPGTARTALSKYRDRRTTTAEPPCEREPAGYPTWAVEVPIKGPGAGKGGYLKWANEGLRTGICEPEVHIG